PCTSDSCLAAFFSSLIRFMNTSSPAICCGVARPPTRVTNDSVTGSQWADISLNRRLTSSMKSSYMVWKSKYSRSEEHTSELQSRENLVCRLLLEKKK